MRRLTLKRGSKFIGSAANLTVVIDGVERGTIANGGEITIPISTGEHEIFMRFHSPIGVMNYHKHTITAGHSDLSGEVRPKQGGFKGDWEIDIRGGNVNVESFVQRVEHFAVDAFRSPRIMNLLNHPNNRRRDLSLQFGEKGMEVRYDVAETRGLKQWATGEDGITIPYAEMGLTVPINPPIRMFGEIRDRVERRLAEEGWKRNRYGAWYR